MAQVNDKTLYRGIEKAYDLINASPAKSDPSVSDLEQQVMESIYILSTAVENGDTEIAQQRVAVITRLANERNRKLKLLN